MTFGEWLEVGRANGFLTKLVSVEETDPAEVRPTSEYAPYFERRLTVRIGDMVFGNTKAWSSIEPQPLIDHLWREAWTEVERGIGRWLRGEPDDPTR